MPDIDFGALLTQGVKSFGQARDYNLALSNARQSASIRLRQIQLQESESALQMDRIKQAMAEKKIESQATALQLRQDLADEKRRTAAFETIEEYEEATREPLKSAVGEIKAGRPVHGGPDVRARKLGRKAVGAYETLDREVPARLEEQLLTPFGRREREADVAFKEAQTVAQRRGPRPTGAERNRDLYVGIMAKTRAGTATDTDMDRLNFITGNYRSLDKEISPKTSDIKNAYQIAGQGYTKKEWQNLDPVDVIRAVNITGRRQVKNWVDQLAPYQVKFKNVPFGADESELVYATPEQIDLIRRAEEDRDNGKISQLDFEEALEQILESE